MAKSTAVRAGRTLLLAAFLAAVLPIFLAPGAGAAELRVQGTSLIEITGGKGGNTWRLVYGMEQHSTSPGAAYYPGSDWGGSWRQGINLVEIPGNRAWFGHTQWLRLIDTEKGLVLGRWQFPDAIVGLTPQGQKVKVQMQGFSPAGGIYKPVVEFDPSNSSIPYWPTLSAMQLNVSLRETEIEFPFKAGVNWVAAPVPPEQAKALLLAIEEMVRRDPTAPWFRMKLWRLKQAAGAGADDSQLAAALATPSTNFTELLRISAFLDRWGAADFASRFYERGYTDFLARGNDPRLFTDRWIRWVLYNAEADRLSEAARARFTANTYKLAPFCASSEFAWLAKARIEEQKGNREQAAVWRERARQSSENTLDMFNGRQRIMVDRLHMTALGCALACILFLMVLFLRYQPQRRLDRAAGQPAGLPKGKVFGARGWLFFAVAMLFSVLLLGLFLYPAPEVAGALALVIVFATLLTIYAIYLWRRAMARKRAGLPAVDFGFFEYWSTRERLAFLLIVLVGWAALGGVGFRVAKVFPAVHGYIDMYAGMGQLGSPVTRAAFQQFPQSPARDLFLATSYQQGGDNDNAEWLYRSIPQYAESLEQPGSAAARKGQGAGGPGGLRARPANSAGHTRGNAEPGPRRARRMGRLARPLCAAEAHAGGAEQQAA